MQVKPLSDAHLEDNRLGVLLIGGPRLGKSWALATAPKPCLYADVQGGLHSIPESPGKEVGGFLYTADGIDVVYPRTWNDLLTFAKVSWKQKPSEQARRFGDTYKTVGVDLLTECNFHLILNEVAPNKDKVTLQDWGIIGKKLKQFVRMMAELTRERVHKVGPHVIISCLRKDVEVRTDTGQETGRIGPMLSGQCFDDVPGVFDLIAYLRVAAVPGPDGKAISKRMLQLEGDGVFVCGTRFHGALDKLEEPNFSRIWEKICAWRQERRQAGVGPALVEEGSK